MTRLLLVDDEPLVLNTLRRTLSFACRGVEVVTSHHPTEALEIIASTHIDVLVTDRNMPAISGEELIRHVRKQSPHTICMLLTGDSTTTEWYSEDGITAMINKPVNMKELQAIISWASTLAKWNESPEVRRWIRKFEQMLPPSRDEFPYDGRTGGKRWFEAYGLATNMDRVQRSSASVMRLMMDDFVPLIAIMTGVIDRLADVADHDVVEHAWQEMLFHAQEARNLLASQQASEHEQLQAQITEYLCGFSQLLASIFDNQASRLGWLLPLRWGFTHQALRQMRQLATLAS